MALDGANYKNVNTKPAYLVGDDIITEVEARAHFEACAAEIGLSGQVVDQYITQSLMLSANRAAEHLDVKVVTATKPVPYEFHSIQSPQQTGGILTLSDAERAAMRERQIAAQQAALRNPKIAA